jgi:hypothetical protein
MVQIFAECYLRECKVVMFRTLSEWYQEFVRERKMFFFERCELQVQPRRCIRHLLHQMKGSVNQTVKGIVEVVLVGVETGCKEKCLISLFVVGTRSVCVESVMYICFSSLR